MLGNSQSSMVHLLGELAGKMDKVGPGNAARGLAGDDTNIHSEV